MLVRTSHCRAPVGVIGKRDLAYAGLADSYTVLASWNILPSNEAFPRSKVAATKALELDKSLSEAHASLGFVNACYDWEWAKADKEFKLAMKANPKMKVLLAGGYYDLATPFFEGVYEMRHLPIPKSLQANISYRYYEAGHMIYVNEGVLKKFHDDVASFIRGTTPAK